jgi:hydrogenase maturation protease
MVVDVGTDFLSAVPLLESCPRVLAIDAMQAGGTPGTVYWCEASAVERNTPRGSIHEMGLLAILEFVEPQKRPEIYFLGVEPERFEYSLELSPPVAAALPQVVKKARELAAMLAPPNGNAILG